LGHRDEQLIVSGQSFQNLPPMGNITCEGSWNLKDEILDEFAKGGLSKTWTVNGL
jgi:hypothetical protein